MNKTRRYPILLAFLSQLYIEVLDELVEIFDRPLAAISNRADRRLTEIRQEIALLAGDKIKLLQELLKILIGPSISDTEVRTAIYKFVPENKLRVTFDECERINEPLDENFFKLLGKRYSYLRQFIPTFLDTLPLDGNAETEGLRKAVGILRDLDESGKRKIPDDAPVDFVTAEWWNYSTIRNATYVLDEILDNETELTILEHTTTPPVTPTWFSAYSICSDCSSHRASRTLPTKRFTPSIKKSNTKI